MSWELSFYLVILWLPVQTPDLKGNCIQEKLMVELRKVVFWRSTRRRKEGRNENSGWFWTPLWICRALTIKRGHYHTSFCSTNQYQNNEGRYIMPLPLIGVDLMFKIMSISCGFIIYYLSLSCMQIYRVSRGVLLLLIWIAQKVHLVS